MEHYGLRALGRCDEAAGLVDEAVRPQLRGVPLACPHPAIKVRGLGRFDVEIAGIPIRRWRAGKARTLFQILLLRQGKVLPRDVLYESLWPEASWSAESSSLKVAAHSLRRIFAEHGADQRSDSYLRLVTCESGYLLEAKNVSVDFDEFDKQITKAHACALATTDDSAHAAPLFQAAVDLYTGDFLSDVTHSWAEVHREWLRSRALCALEWLTDLHLRERDYLAVIDGCKKMLEIEPFCERAYRMLMWTHSQLGHLDQVSRWYQVCVSQLWEGLQIAPSGATQQLYLRAMRGERAAGPTGQPTPACQPTSAGQPVPASEHTPTGELSLGMGWTRSTSLAVRPGMSGREHPSAVAIR